MRFPAPALLAGVPAVGTFSHADATGQPQLGLGSRLPGPRDLDQSIFIFSLVPQLLPTTPSDFVPVLKLREIIW